MMKTKTIITFAFVILLCKVYAQQSQQTFSVNVSKNDILKYFLSGEEDAETGYIKWKPSRSDIYEFNGILGDGFLYSRVDSFFTSTDESSESLLVFHTISMVQDEGKKTTANSCHVCGVNMGYIAFTKEADSLYPVRFKKNFATHGSFGAVSYKLHHINFGDGYDLIRVDDAYNGMGTESVASVFYYNGEKILSMVSSENNSGNKEKNQKGYYEFSTHFSFNKENHTLSAAQTGFTIDEKTGKRVLTKKIKTWKFEGDTLQF